MQADREKRRLERPSRSSRPPKSPRRLHGSRRTILVAAAGCALLIWVLSGFLLRALSSGEVLDGTRMSGIALGGQTREQAAALIGGLEPRLVQLSEGNRTVIVRASRAGLVIGGDKSADRAYSAGRSGIGSFLNGPLVLFGGRELEPEYKPVDSKRLALTV